MDKLFVFIMRKILNELIEFLKVVVNVEMWDKEDEVVFYELFCEKVKYVYVLLIMFLDCIDGELFM